MRGASLVQVLGVVAFVGIVVFVAASQADDWSDWVVYGVFVATLFGVAIAVNERRYPTKKRTFVRHSEDKERKPK